MIRFSANLFKSDALSRMSASGYKVQRLPVEAHPHRHTFSGRVSMKQGLKRAATHPPHRYVRMQIYCHQKSHQRTNLWTRWNDNDAMVSTKTEGERAYLLIEEERIVDIVLQCIHLLRQIQQVSVCCFNGVIITGITT